MKLTILRKMQYRNTFIYVVQMQYTFQYLFAMGSDIYQQHVTITPSLLKRIAWNTGLINSPYTTEQLEEGEKIVLSGAMDSIDKIIANNEKARDVRKEIVNRNDDEKCLWRVSLENSEGAYYQCLNHGIAVKMEDGVKPTHTGAVLSPIQTV